LKLNTDILLNFLLNRGWEIKEQNDKFHFLKAPAHFSFPNNYVFSLPYDKETVDFERFLSNSIKIVAEIYELRVDDLIKIIESESEVFSLRIMDKNTNDGSISFGRFETLLEKIKGILISTASFVISKDPLYTKSLDEAEQYLNHCSFLQTEKGSFISKINLPTKEKLVEQNLFGEDAIYAKDINQRIKSIIAYLNNEIFSGIDISLDYEYIKQNKEFINIKLLKQFEELYSKVEIKDLEFTFDSVESSERIIVNNMNDQKLKRLDSFIQRIDEILNAEIDLVVTGKIIALRSKNPDGTTNSIKVTGITEDRLPVTVSANLSSDDYKYAIELHKEKTQVKLTGLAKKEKTLYKFIRVDKFEAI
jgi:hypothetical protein